VAGEDPEVLQAGLVEGEPVHLPAGVLDAQDLWVLAQGGHGGKGQVHPGVLVHVVEEKGHPLRQGLVSGEGPLPGSRGSGGAGWPSGVRWTPSPLEP